MPLTNVWTQDRRSEWVRTTASAMEKVFPHGASATSHIFRCYNCFQYVTYINTGDRASHFKHNIWEENKDCEDRTFGTGGYAYGSGITDVPDPMRVQLDGNRVFLEIGFFPAPTETIEKAVKERMMIRIRGESGLPDEYRVDRSRFEPHSMTWLRLPFAWALNYSVEFEPMIKAAGIWNIRRTPLKKYGTVFDKATGKRIPEKSDISAGRDYYIVCDRWKSFYSRGGVQIGQKTMIDDHWCLYHMSIPSCNDDASDFCFEAFHLRLTTRPSDIKLLWPPAVEGDDLIDTNQKQLFMYIKGESDFETYPKIGIESKDVLQTADKARVVKLSLVSKLQMVSATRYNQRLRFLYVRPWEKQPGIYEPDLKVLDDQNRDVPDQLKYVPPRGIIRILSEVDASANVEDQDGFLYSAEISAGQETRLQDLKRGMRIVICQGLEVLRSIEIGVRKKAEAHAEPETPALWRGRLVPMPRRYAWLLTRLDRSGELYRRTEKALKDSVIPIDGLRMLNELAGGR